MFGYGPLTIRTALLVGSASFGVLSGCSGGGSFIAQGAEFDATSGESDGGVVVVVRPNDDATSPVDANFDSGMTGMDASETAKRSDATFDASSCSSSQLACGGSCVPIDTSNCGACNARCAAPDGGTPTCVEASSAHRCDVACGANLTHCGDSCVTVQTDTSNCGRCGHSCVAGACESGQCQSWTVTSTSAPHTGLPVLRAGTFGHADIATDGTNVIWVDPYQGILEVSATATASTAITNLSPMQQSTSSSPVNLAVANGVVVWTVSDVNNGISLWAAQEGAKNPSGAMIASLGTATAQDVPSGLALDSTASNAYFIDSETRMGSAPHSPGLYQCNLANKSCTFLYTASVPSNNALANDVAMANSGLFWTDSAAGALWRAVYSPNSMGTVVSDEDGPCLLALDASNVYWAGVDLTGDAGMPTFSIHSTSQATPGAVTPVVPTTTGSLVDMASDGENVYFIESTASADGQLEYVPVNGGSPQALKANQLAYGLAVGGGAVYWINGDNTIEGMGAP
jgi:hypothetical protein